MNSTVRWRGLCDRSFTWVLVYVLLALVGGVLLWQLTGLRERRIMRGNIQAHQKAHVIGMLQGLAYSTKLAVRKSGKEPPAQIHLLLEYLREHCPTGLEVAAGDNLDPETGSLFDDWQTPVKLIVESATDYTLMSCGPNRADEGGAGDDLVFTFNPMETEAESDISYQQDRQD